MAQDVYVNCDRKVTKQLEVVDDVYENIDVIKGHDAEKREKGNTKTNQQAQQKGGETIRSRCSRHRLTAVCVVVLLCVLLLTISTVLGIKFSNAKNNQLQTSAGWRKFNSSFYYISDERRTWNEGRQDCKDKGADLVIINNREEQEFISTDLSDNQAWIGLRYSGKDGVWKWVDDSTLTTGYLYAGGPITSYGDCALIASPTADVLTWTGYPCNYTVFSICEKRIKSK